MSTVPQSLRDAGQVIRAGALTEAEDVRIITGPGTTSKSGYHAGTNEGLTPGSEYSTRRARDRAGLSTASSALDISYRGPRPDGKRFTAASKRAQIAFTAWLVGEAKAGRADLMMIVGPGADGRAYGWYRWNGWKPVGPRPKGNSHEAHTHVSFPRDTEFGDRASMFRPYWPALPTPVPDSPETPDEEPEEDTLQDELDEAVARAEAAEARVTELEALAAEDVADAKKIVERHA